MLNETIVSEIATKLGMPEVLEQFRSTETPAEGVNPFAEKLGLFEVFTTDQLSERIGNERTLAATEATKTATGNTYGAIDTRTLKATGLAKNPGESTVDYTERAFKEKFGTKGDENAELTRLRGEITAKDQLLTQKDTELQQIQLQHGTERKQGQINASLDGAINTLPINTTPELLDSQREFVKFRLGQTYDIDVVEGKVVFKEKGTENVVRDTKTAAPMTAAALVELFAPKVVSLKKPSTAQGSGFDQSRTNLNDGEPAAMDYSAFTSKDDFAAALAKQGIAVGSARAGELFKQFKAARPDLK